MIIIIIKNSKHSYPLRHRSNGTIPVGRRHWDRNKDYTPWIKPNTYCSPPAYQAHCVNHGYMLCSQWIVLYLSCLCLSLSLIDLPAWRALQEKQQQQEPGRKWAPEDRKSGPEDGKPGAGLHLHQWDGEASGAHAHQRRGRPAHYYHPDNRCDTISLVGLLTITTLIIDVIHSV